MFIRLAHVCIHANDLAASFKFYGEVLGLRQHFTFVRKGIVIGAYFDVGKETYVEIFQVDHAMPPTNNGITHFCIQTDEINGIVQKIRAAGVECTSPAMGCDKSWQAWTADPDGNKIEIHQYTPESAQIHGGEIEVNW